MRLFACWCFLLCFLLPPVAHAGELSATVFVQTPKPAPGDLLDPCALALDAARGRCYVADSGLRRVIALTLDGAPAGVWPLPAGWSHGIEDSPSEPLLPLRMLAVAGKTVYLLKLDRNERRVELTPVDGPGGGRSVTLPESATYGAVALDAAGRVLIATLQLTKGRAVLLLSRETAGGDFEQVGSLYHPCDGETTHLSLTGFTVAPDGRVAIGIAQTAADSFVHSWLVQGTMSGAVLDSPLVTTHHFALFDQRGKVLDRFRAAVELAGTRGYPAKPCVPLFTTLACGPEGVVISGGHALDPFFRVYGRGNSLLRSLPRQAGGAQPIASVPAAGSVRLFAASPTGRVRELALDGRLVGSIGNPFSADLRAPVSLAADPRSVYVALRRRQGFALARFAADGTFLWQQPLLPPTGLEGARPYLAVPSSDRVLIGWRLPDAAGVGWVETVLEDGMPGLPLWKDPVTTAEGAGDAPAPLLVAGSGSVYVFRQLSAKDGARLQAFSSTGTFLQQFPPEIQGITAVAAETGYLAWAHTDAAGMLIEMFTPQGSKRGWKRVPRPAKPQATLTPVLAGAWWGWLSATRSLLKLDETFTVVDEVTLLDPAGTRLGNPLALAGNRRHRRYLAVPDRILAVEMPEI
ncbi:MAG: NHL repeat-containing protein [Armatimonadota bacterium]